MSFDLENLSESARRRPGLIFNAEGVMLTANFCDELAAYRARREWISILNGYFLLERERDYEIAVSTVEQFRHYRIDCNFVSACGRYAFWRLINHQAPDAERKLCGTSSDFGSRRTSRLISPIMQLNGETNATPSVMGGGGTNPARVGPGVLRKLLKLFE